MASHRNPSVRKGTEPGPTDGEGAASGVGTFRGAWGPRGYVEERVRRHTGDRHPVDEPEDHGRGTGQRSEAIEETVHSGISISPVAESHTPPRSAVLTRAPRSDKVFPDWALRRRGYLNGSPRWRIITMWH